MPTVATRRKLCCQKEGKAATDGRWATNWHPPWHPNSYSPSKRCQDTFWVVTNHLHLLTPPSQLWLARLQPSCLPVTHSTPSKSFTLHEHQWTDIQRQIRYDPRPQRTCSLIKLCALETDHKGRERKRNSQLRGKPWGQEDLCAMDSQSLINPNPYSGRGISRKYLTILQSSFCHFHCFLLDHLPISFLRLWAPYVMLRGSPDSWWV